MEREIIERGGGKEKKKQEKAETKRMEEVAQKEKEREEEYEGVLEKLAATDEWEVAGGRGGGDAGSACGGKSSPWW